MLSSGAIEALRNNVLNSSLRELELKYVLVYGTDPLRKANLPFDF